MYDIDVIAGKLRLLDDSHSHVQFQAKRETFFIFWALLKNLPPPQREQRWL